MPVAPLRRYKFLGGVCYLSAGKGVPDTRHVTGDVIVTAQPLDELFGPLFQPLEDAPPAAALVEPKAEEEEPETEPAAEMEDVTSAFLLAEGRGVRILYGVAEGEEEAAYQVMKEDEPLFSAAKKSEVNKFLKTLTDN